MTLEELYKKLDMAEPEDFGYFEQIAELLECEDELEFDLFCAALSGVGPESALDLIENYFEDLSDALPDDDDDIVSLVDSIKQNLLLCAEQIDDANVRNEFAQQLYKFRNWYHKEGNALVDGKPHSILSAVAEHRAEKLGIGSHTYDFSVGCDYDLDDISLQLGAFSKIDILGRDDDGLYSKTEQ